MTLGKISPNKILKYIKNSANYKATIQVQSLRIHMLSGKLYDWKLRRR